MKTVAEKLVEYAENAPEGHVLSAKGLLHLGSRAAVDQGLSRLTRDGRLIRIGRGLYVRPVRSRFGTRPPRPEAVAEGIARHTGEAVVPGGAASANALGLSTQVPVRPVYLTSARSRRLRLGRQTLELKHEARARFLQEEKGGALIRALEWLGESTAPASLRETWPGLSKVEKKRLVEAMPSLPGWLAASIGAHARDPAA